MSHGRGVVVALSVSPTRKGPKHGVPVATLVAGWGIDGDGHAGPGSRQVSLVAIESIKKVQAQGVDVGPGSFAENVTVGGLDLMTLRVGDVIKIGEAELRVTQRGKECHDRCEIYRQLGDCIMPREGLFAAVRHGGVVRVGDAVTIERMSPAT